MPSLLKWSVPLLALVAACALPAYAQAPRAAANWEYVVIIEGAGGVPGVQQLNTRGAAGWELVQVSCRTRSDGSAGDCYYYMKRPRP